MHMDTATMHTTSIAMTLRGMAKSRIAIRISTTRSRTATRISPIFITGIGIDLVTMGYCGDAHMQIQSKPCNRAHLPLSEQEK